jgi:hypothetical protein
MVSTRICPVRCARNRTRPTTLAIANRNEVDTANRGTKELAIASPERTERSTVNENVKVARKIANVT